MPAIERRWELSGISRSMFCALKEEEVVGVVRKTCEGGKNVMVRISDMTRRAKKIAQTAGTLGSGQFCHGCF